MTEIYLCSAAWDLYDAWTRLLEKQRPKASAKEKSAARAAYIKHRKECKDCTPWQDKIWY